MSGGQALPTSLRSGARTIGRLPRAEAWIGADLAAVAARVREVLGPDLEALLLVGSYARGEGGVVATREGGFAAYNDYDLIAVVRNRPAASLRAPLLALSRRLSAEREIEVDLWPVDESALESLPPTLFWLDVSLGAVELLVGDPGVLARLRPVTPRAVPHAEAARLLMNRAVGLALSNLEPVDHDLRRRRHAHKAVLACGDVLLLAADLYGPSVADRAAALEGVRAAPRVGDALVDAYADAMRFRARPDQWRPAGGEGLEAWYRRLLALVSSHHLAYEHARVGAPETAVGYASFRGPLFRGAPDLSAGSLTALRAFLQGRAPLTPPVGHPRERLARVAVALAYGHASAGCRAIAARLLGREGDTRGTPDEVLRSALLGLAEVSA